MAIEQLKVKGIDITIPACQYYMNEKQQFVCLGIDLDFSKGIFDIEDVEGIEYIQMGKLSGQNFIFQAQIENSLNNDSWDFEKYPDPEIILICQK